MYLHPHKFLIFLFFWLSIGSICVADQPTALPDFTTPLTIPELVDIAFRNNPETRTAWWNAQRAAAASAISTSSYYPQVGFRANVAHGRDYKFPNGQETNYTSVGGDFVLSYLLYDFGERRANGDAARAALSAANWQSDFVLQKVLYNVVYNIYTFLNSQETLLARQASLADAQSSLSSANELFRSGLRSITDVYTLQATVSDLQIGIALQTAETDIARAKLAASLGIDVNSPLNVAPLPDPQLDQESKREIECLIALAHQQRADLMAKHADLQQKVALKEKTRSSCLPKLRFNGDTGYKRYLHDSSNGFNYNVGINLDVPLFNGFESTYQNRIAYNDIKITESELERLQLDIALEVLTYYSWFQAAQEILKFAGENLQNSLKTFEGVLDKYKAGTQSIFDLIASQKQLADARIKHGDAKTRWYRSLAQLAYATGSIMPHTEVPCVSSQ